MKKSKPYDPLPSQNHKPMKFYIWKHKDTADRATNYYPLSKVVSVKDGMYGVAVHAFFKRKDAIEYLKSIYDESIRDLFELVVKK